MGFDDQEEDDDLLEIREWLEERRAARAGDASETLDTPDHSTAATAATTATTATTATEDAYAPSAAELVAAARRFHRRLRTTLDFALEDAGISYARFEVLETLAEDPTHHAASIAWHLGTSRQAVSMLVARLKRDGHLESDVTDNGVQPLQITDSGRALLATCHTGLNGFRSMFERMEPAKRLAFLEAVTAADAAITPPSPWLS